MNTPSTPAATPARAMVGITLTVATAWIGTGDTILADAVCDVKYHWIPCLAQVIERTRINHHVVVSERVASLGQYDLTVTHAFALLGRFDHVLRRKELAMFDVDHSPCPGCFYDQRGLHAEICRDLDHIADFCGRRSLAGVMDIGQERKAEILLDPLQHFQPFIKTGPHVKIDVAAIILGEAALASREGSTSRFTFERFRCTQHHALLLDHARTAYEE